MKTTTRGLLTELRVQAKLAEMGAHLLVPLGHDHPFDLVAYQDGRFSRIQIKTMRYGRAACQRNGTLFMSFSSNGVGGKTVKCLTAAECDVVVGWHPETGLFYAAVPTGGRGVHLRVTPALNNNTRLVNNAATYELTSLDQIFR